MYDGLDRPLFGEARPRDKYINYTIGAFTLIFVLVTVAGAIIKDHKPYNIMFSGAILLVCLSELVLIFWYRQGDLDPKFRKLIYYNAFTIILLCIVAMMFIFKKDET